MSLKRGFTLLELIIVIVVIGILASIALPSYIKTVERSRAAEAKNMLGAIRSAQMRYFEQYYVYAASTNNLDILTVNASTQRYFTYFGRLGSYIGRARRATLELPSAYPQYWIYINAAGGFNITAGYEFLL